ncbi:MAG: ATP phosphoribosyltransferase [Defluviitaleaceae bacterium]|nr:ATP phosphoribosyltransferase [Defluviitaleaceae bacterium]
MLNGRKIEIALPKGQRLLGKAYEIFKEAGYASAALEHEIASKGRKQLEYASDCGRANFLLVRIADIPQYVDRNWADIGISAFDCYREYELSSVVGGHAMRGDNFISTLLPDLNLCGFSRFCVAGLPENREYFEKCKNSHEKILSVATQHPHIASAYFKRLHVLADIVTISGSSELMPRHGEVDVIFDIVETGQALVENGLEIFEEAMTIQTKLLVSKAALKYDAQIAKLIGEIKNAIK